MIGLLWYDNSKDPLSQKVERAAAYYLKKYGKQTRLVYVNPSETIDQTIENIRIAFSNQVLPNHFYVIEEDKTE